MSHAAARCSAFQSRASTSSMRSCLPPRTAFSGVSCGAPLRRQRATACRATDGKDEDKADVPNPFGSPASAKQAAAAAPAAAPKPAAAPRPDAAAAAQQERLLEAREASIRGKAPKKQMQILGVNTPTEQEKAAANSQYAPWKPWQLFPEGFEQMSTAQKLTELYMGQRGFMFWANKLAYGAAISMLVAWVFFRFVGPNLGLYQLAGDLVRPSF